MNKFEGIVYKKNFISQVICKIDFLENIDETVLFSDEMRNVVKKTFSNEGMTQVAGMKLTDNNQPANPTQEIKIIQKKFSTDDQKNAIILSSKFLALDLKCYESFESLMVILKEVLGTLYCKRFFTVARIGLRYINIFNPDTQKVLKKYFKGDIASILSKEKTILERLKLVKSMNTSQYQVEDMALSFNYGLYNRSHPNILKENDLVLDYDCYTTQNTTMLPEIIEYINKAHSIIQDLFEDSITDDLRKIMGS